MAYSSWGGGTPQETFVKIPSREVVDFNLELTPPDALAELFIEDIGGVELSQLTNYQTVYGTNVNYQIVYGLQNISADYNPADWLTSKLPSAYLRETLNYNDYYESITPMLNGNIEIEFSNLPSETDVEVQIDSNAIIDIQVIA